MKKLSVLLLLSLFLSVPRISAQRLDIIGHSGGFSTSLTLALDRLFLSQSLYLKAFDPSSDALAVKGELEIGDERVPGGLIVSGTTGYLYSGSMVYAVNLSNPDNPVFRGSLDLGGTKTINGIALAGNTLVVSQQEDGMRILDVSNPDALVLRGTFTANSRDVSAVGTRAYVLDGTSVQVGNASLNLIVVNIANPAAPSELGRISVPRAGEILVSGNTAFTFGRGSGHGFRAINVANPGAMTIVDSADLLAMTGSFQSSASGAAILGNRLYVAVAKDLKVYDISNPANLTEVGLLAFPKGRVTAVDAAGTRGAVISDDQIHVLDLAGGGTPTIRSTLNEPSLIHDIAVDEDREYVVDNKGVYCYEAPDESTPAVLRGFFPARNFSGFGSVAAKGPLALTLNFECDTLTIVDFTNPAAPVLRSRIKVSDPSSGGDVGVRGDFAYVSSPRTKGVIIVDISNPTIPTVRGTHLLSNTTSNARALHVPATGSLIFVQSGAIGSEPKELEIVDVSNPAAPVMRKLIVESQIHAVTTEGNLLFYGFDSQNPKLKVMDITNPANPIAVNEYVLNTPPIWEMEVMDSIVIASIPGGSIHTFSYAGKTVLAKGPIAKVRKSSVMKGKKHKKKKKHVRVTTAGGYSDREAGYTYGSYGKYDVQLQMNDSLRAPVMTYNVMDSLDVNVPYGADSLVQVTEIAIKANEERNWDLQSLKFKTIGSGDVQHHIKEAQLYKVQNGKDSLVATGQFITEDESLKFRVSQIIEAGSTETFYLKYLLSSNLDCPAKNRSGEVLDDPPTFGVELAPEDVEATLDDSLAVVQNASSRTNSGMVTIGCMENTTTKRLFNNIKAALADSSFNDGETISISRGMYNGPVVLFRRVNIVSREGSARTYFRPQRSLANPVMDNTAIVVCTGGASLKDLTIGNDDGGNPSGKGVKVGSCENGSDFVNSVMLEGVTFQNLSIGIDVSRALNLSVKRCRFRNCITGAELTETMLRIFSGNLLVENVNGVRIVHGINGNFATSRFIFNSGVAVDASIDTNADGTHYVDIDGNVVAYADANGNLIIGSEFLENGEKGTGTREEKNPVVAGDNDPSAIRLRGGIGGVIGNRFENDSLDAVFTENGSTPFFRMNLFLSSDGFALNNGDPSVIIDARENWWGAPSGPGGAGPGLGDEVSENVDFADWLEEEVGLVAVAQADTIFVPKGTEDLFHIFFQNWKVRDDEIDLNVTDDLGWLMNGGTTRKEMTDSVGAEHQVVLAVPNVADGTVNVVRYTATSVADGSDRESDSVVLISYSSEMFALGISPGDTVLLDRGDSVQFYILGRDQHGRPVEVGTIGWEAEGGTISANGMYIAGGTDGLFEVRARANGFTAPGYVRVGDVPTSVREIAVTGESAGARLLGASPNPFATNAIVRFALPKPGIVSFTLHNVQGEEVAAFHSRLLEAGEHEITLNAESLESGLYYLRLRSVEGTSVLKVMVVR